MANTRFFKKTGPISCEDLAKAGKAEVRLPQSKTSHEKLRDVATLVSATNEHLSFLHNNKYIEQLKQSKAGACVLHPDNVVHAPKEMILFISEHPYRAYAQMVKLFYPYEDTSQRREGNGYIHPAAVIHPTAKIGERCWINAGVVIESHVEIGAGCYIDANTSILEGVRIGEDTKIGANVAISHAEIGNRVVILNGAKIGQPGFGFFMDNSGHVSVPQLGGVRVGDDVEIGANTTIDRGALDDTIIGSGCRIDNLVQIAHNVQLGRGCVIVSQAGISGSTTLGDYVVVAGQAGLTGHLEIGSHAKVAAQSGVMRNIEAGATVGGSPAVPIQTWRKQMVVLASLTTKKSKKDSS